MPKPTHLTSAADAAHALVLELYRFTARWPECERQGLSLEVRRAGHDLSSCLACAEENLRASALRRALHDARKKHARLRYLLRLAADLGYRKLSPSARVEEMMDHLCLDLDQLDGRIEPDAGFEGVDEYAGAGTAPPRSGPGKRPRSRAAANHRGGRRPDY